MVEELTNTLNR